MKQYLRRVITHIETKHTAHLMLFVIVASFIAVESPELKEFEAFPDFFDHVLPYLDSCELDEMPTRNSSAGFEDSLIDMKPTRSPLKWWTLCLSDKLFENPRVIPFIYSIILIPITYSFATHLTQRKTVGIITVLVLVTSGTFTTFDTTSTYEQSWVVFLLLSLIMVMRGNALGMIVFFVLSVLSKPIALIYVPVIFAFIYHQHEKFLAIAFGLLITVMIIIGLTSSVDQIGGGFEFNLDELLHGFYNWWFYLNASMLVAMTLPLVLWRLIVMRKKLPEVKPIIIGILVIIISVPLIDGFTNQLNHAYRFVPMIIFVGVGIAMILTNFVLPRSEIFNIRKTV